MARSIIKANPFTFLMRVLTREHIPSVCLYYYWAGSVRLKVFGVGCRCYSYLSFVLRLQSRDICLYNRTRRDLINCVFV